MKNKILTLATFGLFITISLNSQIKVLSTGTLNLGNTLNNNGYLTIDYTGYPYAFLSIYPTVNNTAYLGKSGKGFMTVYTYSTQNPSDVRLKENIKEISNALNTIKKLSGVEFDYKADAFYNSNKSSKEPTFQGMRRKNILGFLAQDVQKVLPQVVFHDDSTDLYSIDYTKVIPVIVEAMKEQQTIIESLQADIITLKKSSGNLKSAPVATDIIPADAKTTATLAQNAPNPFNQSTLISYYLPENVNKASLNIYDMNGVQLKTIPVNTNGEGSVTIQANEFKPGMYYYTLLADGKEIDTKRMIITE